MDERFVRAGLLLGEDNMNRLSSSRVAVFGIGGVGGAVAEALARCGIGEIHLIDNDVVSKSNINRQIVALESTIGKYKVDVMEERIKDINPQAVVVKHACFFLPENSSRFHFDEYDYVVDAVDTVTAKLEIICAAKKENTPVISCMGAGNKLDPEQLCITDIYKTSICPLAKVMRKELKKRGINDLKVVYSKEEPVEHKMEPEFIQSLKEENPVRRALPGSVSFVPPAAGLMAASVVIRDLIK